jgi:hypothetical protein
MPAREPPAARLERISEPGGGTISRLAYDQIDGKLALRFRNLGPQKLKNITKPIEVFAIESSGQAVGRVKHRATTLRAVAAALKARAVPSLRGRRWDKVTVRTVLAKGNLSRDQPNKKLP